MNPENLFSSLEQLVSSGVWVPPLAALIAAFVFGQLLAWTYEQTYRGLSYSRGLSESLVLVCISAVILVLAMQYSLIAGLGLFGILSMIRFRTDLKSPRDLVFVMGAACLGVTCGVNAILEASLGTGVFCAVALYLATGPIGSRNRFDGVLRFNLPAGTEIEPTLSQVLRRYCLRRLLLSTGEIENGTLREHVYQIKFFRKPEREELLEALKSELNAREIRLMLQDATSEY